MEIDIQTLVRRTDPKSTVLFFGAGSSIPSGAPSAADLVQGLSKKFHVEGSESLDLKLISAIIEMQYGRSKLVGYLRSVFQKLNPQKGILNVPDFDWASIFTTNYDELIEKSFRQRRKTLEVYDSNYSFSSREDINAQKLFKLHGSISRDIIDGHNSRIIISATDYDNTQEYRELLFANLKEQLLSKDIIIIGYSLGDQYLRETLEFALEVKKNRGAQGNMTLLIYEKTAGLSALYSQRGFDVCFGGIDEFFVNPTNVAPNNQLSFALSDDPLDRARRVLPCTLTVSTQRVNQQANLAALFNGRAASYADIMRGWSFNREFSMKLEQQLITESAPIALILGPAGSGKTSGVRQALNRLVDRDVFCWEHVDDHALPWRDWVEIDKELKKRQRFGVLFIDNAHEHLSFVNTFIDALPKDGGNCLKIVVSSSKPQWNHRVKSSGFFTNCVSYEIGPLAENEIDSLLQLLDNQSEVSDLVD